MRKKKQSDKIRKTTRRSSFVFEELEPRVLLSADLPVDVAPDYNPDAAEEEVLWQDIHALQTETATLEEVSRELVFVDTDTPDYQQLVDDLLADQDESRRIGVILLDNDSDGIGQITDTLNKFGDLDAVHIISHGTDGSIDLGGSTLDSAAVQTHADRIQDWSGAFSESGDLLIYGCNLAATSEGESLVNTLATLTGTDVAASDDITGSTEMGGDWELEYNTGEIDADLAVSAGVQQSYQAVLATETVADDLGTGDFTGNTGSQSWTGDWIETDSGGAGATNGNVVVTGVELSIRIAGSSIAREVDLSDASSATFSFDYRTGNGIESTDPDSLVVEVSGDGGVTWTTLEDINYLTGANSGSKSYDISAYTAVDTQIRFRANNGYDGPNEYFYVDNVQIQYTTTAPVNDEPVLSGANDLTAIDEEDVTNGGTLVSVLIAGQINDADAAALEGIAVVGVDDTNGTWEYTTDGGANWYAFGAVDTANARLLAADADTRVRFVPDADWNGTVTDGITFRAWDQTAGTVGGTASIEQTVFDTFDSNSYSGNDGTQNWSTDWIETDSSGSAGNPSSGFIKVINGAIFFRVNGLGDNTYRGVNLDGATDVTMSFDYINNLRQEDTIVVQVSDDGGVNYTTLATFSETENNVDGSLGFDISAFATADTRIRVYVENTGGTGDFSLDNLLISYTPGTDSGTGGSSAFSAETASSSITVKPVDDPVTIGGDTSGTGDEDTVITGTLTATDLADGLTDGSYFTVTGAASNGTASIDPATGLWIYTPNADFNGSDAFTVTITDDDGHTATQVIGVTVTPVNDNPVANADTASTNEDVALNNIDVLGNDTDVDGDTRSVTGASALNGTVTVNPDGTLNYTPNLNFNGTDTVTYDISDGQGGTATGTLTITVTAVNDNPVANADTASTNEDVTLNNIDVLGNDTDVDGDTLSITSASAANGTVTVNPDGTLNYTPNLNFNGTDTISYDIADGNGGVATGTLTITITAVNDNPVTNADTATTSEDVALNNIDVLGNDTDVDGDTLSVTGATAANGSVTVNPDGTLNYTPNLNYNGTDTISYDISDGNGGFTNAGLVDLTVTAVNDAPVSNMPGAQTTSMDTPMVFTSLDGNAITVSDPDGSGATLEITLEASNGTLSLSGTVGLVFSAGDGIDDASMTFTGDAFAINAALDGLLFQPNAGYQGVASLQLINDDLGNIGSGGALNAVDSISISVVETAPVFGSTSVPLDEILVENPDLAVMDEAPAPDEAAVARSAVKAAIAVEESRQDESLGSGKPVSPVTSDLLSTGEVRVKASIIDTGFEAKPEQSRDRFVYSRVWNAIADPLVSVRAIAALPPGALIWEFVDLMTDQITDNNQSVMDGSRHLLGTTASGVTFAFSAGYVSWLLRAGYLSAAVLSSAPLWREFDPLPILSAAGQKKDKKGRTDQDTQKTDDSTVEDIFESDAGRGSGPTEAV